MTDKPTIPTVATTNAVLSILATWFEERGQARQGIAAEFRAEGSPDFAEQDAIARTFSNAARITWELAGGKHGERRHDRFIRVSTLDLAALIESLDQRSPANECTNAERKQYEITIEQQLKRIAELEAMAAAKYVAEEDLHRVMLSHGFPTTAEAFLQKLESLYESPRGLDGLPSDDDVVCRVDTPNDCCAAAVLEAIGIFREECTRIVSARDAEVEKRNMRIAELEAKVFKLEGQIPGCGPALEGDGARLRQIVTGGTRPIILDDTPTEAQLAERWERRAHKFSRPYRERIAELEKRLADAQIEADAHVQQIDELVAGNKRAEARVRAWEERTGESGESAPRIVGAKLEALPCVDGKTPAQVNKEAYAHAVMNHHESEGVSAWGIAADAVLRAFQRLTADACIAELEAERDTWQSDALSCHMVLAAIRDYFGLTPQWNNAQWSELLPRIKNRLTMGDKLVDGKTPGQTRWDAAEHHLTGFGKGTPRPWTLQSIATQQREEFAANAVLQTFGPAMVQGALGQMRDRIQKMITKSSKWMVLSVIDAEIAKRNVPTLARVPSDDLQRLRDRVLAMGENQTTAQFKQYVLRLIDDLSGHASLAPNELRCHDFLGTRDLIRGVAQEARGGFGVAWGHLAFGSELRKPQLSAGFVRLPELLELKLGDIIEIRVIERADRDGS